MRMTREELLRKLEGELGLKLTPASTDRPEYYAVSPSGARLFRVSLTFSASDGWMFAGCGSLLQEQWDRLVRLRPDGGPG